MSSVLVVQYSQSGQLSDVARHLTAPLREVPDVELTIETLRPRTPFPFPWTVFDFLDAFPESVYLDAGELEPLGVDPGKRFDLVILCYQVWFLSPSLPTTTFLKSAAAASLLRDTPVVTVIACRNMWLMAQEQVKALVAANGGRLVGNVALIDAVGTAASFLATPLWVLTGNKGPRLGGLIPKAGVAETEIVGARRFGERILAALRTGAALDESLLRGLHAVTVNPRLISSERIARRSFRIWGALLRALGPRGSFARKPVLIVYVVFLITLILTVVPISALLKALLAPFQRARVAAQRAYFAQPSGE